MVATDLYREQDKDLRVTDIWKEADVSSEHFTEIARRPLAKHSRVSLLPIDTLYPSQAESDSETIHATSSDHLLVAAIGFALSGILGAVMLITDKGNTNGYPLSYFAASFVLVGLAVGFFSEWRIRARKE